MKAAIAGAILAALSLPMWTAAQESRTYWGINPDEFARIGSVHTHVQITAWVRATRMEPDGDRHIQLVPAPGAAAPFFIAECIPKLPCGIPVPGSQITVQGISRYDLEHKWWEVHPVETLVENRRN